MREHGVPPFTHGNDFIAYFNGKDEDFFLLVDDIDELRAASLDVVHDFLGALNFLKDYRTISYYSLDGMIATGTFSALSTPFRHFDGVMTIIQVPYFSLSQVESLFQKDDRFTLDPDVVKDIWIKSGGHPATVCLCGQFIRDRLQSSDDSQNVTFAHWQQNTIHELYEWFGLHPPYKNMLQTLQDPDAHDAVALLYYNFLGYSGPVCLYSKKDAADFLTVEGVLNKPDILQSEYQMSSAFVDGFLQTKLLVKFPKPHLHALPGVSSDMAIVDILRTALWFFSKEFLQDVCSRSTETAHVPVCGHQGWWAYRPGVYESELSRILSNEVHPNIILTQGTPTERTIILEVAENSDAASVQSQISRAVEYKDLLGADEAWLVHFTRQDDYEPIWQSSDELAGGMNVVHFQHDAYFSNIVMSARWRDSKGQDCQIMKEIIELK